MCRLLAARVSRGSDELQEILEAFRKACAHDELHPRKESHRDGWGWLLVTPTRMIHYRTTEPVESDEDGFDSLAKAVDSAEEGFVIAHCRKASKGLKKWVLASHPAPRTSLKNRYVEVWVAFNGTIPLERLGWRGEVGYVTDTHLIASAIAEHVVENGMRDGLIEGLRDVASVAGNAHGAVVAAIVVGDGAVHAALLNHYPMNKPELERYYRAQIIRSEEVMAVASPTVALYHGGSWYELGEDEVVYLGELRLRVTD